MSVGMALPLDARCCSGVLSKRQQVSHISGSAPPAALLSLSPRTSLSWQCSGKMTIDSGLWGQRLRYFPSHQRLICKEARDQRLAYSSPVCGPLQGDLPAQLIQRASHVTSIEQLVEIGEDALTAAGQKLEQDFPALSFPAHLLEGSSDALKEFMKLPGEERTRDILLFVGAWVYMTARPGVLAGAIDAYAFAPLQLFIDSVRGRRNFKRTDFLLGRRMGEGSFGTVYEGGLRSGIAAEEEELGRRSKKLYDAETRGDLQRVVLKKVKMDKKGAVQSGEVEEWFNLRMRRVAPEACAKYMGSFVADKTRGQFSKGGQWLVWKYEGDETLADYMTRSDFPENLGPILFGKSFLDSTESNRRRSLIVKQILRQLMVALKKMHSTGIVHRDIKPSNIVITNKGSVKLIDFGAATDLRVGKNYVPDMGMLDPDYCPPELYVMPETTPIPPPEPVAALLSPILWQLNHPDLFDIYSAGILFLQMSVPSLRTPVGLQTFKAELKDADYDLNEWRRRTRTRPNLELLEVDGGKGWDLVTKMVCRRGALMKGRLSAAEALRHPYFLLAGDQAAALVSKFTLSG